MLGLALALAAVAPTPGIYGIGNTPCSEMKPEMINRVGEYVTGFWSGMNAAGNTPQIGHSTDARGILMEVVKACAAAPSLSVGLATIAAHMRMERLHR